MALAARAIQTIERRHEMFARARANRAFVFRRAGFEPSPLQDQILASDARFKVLACGRRFGKTVTGAAELLERLFLPDAMLWIVAPTYTLGEKEFRWVWNWVVDRPGFPPPRRKAYAPEAGKMYLDYRPRGGLLEVRSGEDPDKSLVGEGLDFVVVAEAAKFGGRLRRIWENYIRPALSDRQGGALLSFVPEGMGFPYQLWQRGQDPQFPEWRSWRYKSADGGWIRPEEIEEARRELTEDAFAAQYEAEFRQFSGLVYKEFDELVHVQDFDLRPGWRTFLGFDFGYDNPFVCLVAQLDPSDRLWIVREHYRSWWTTDEHATFLRGWLPPYEAGFCDPSGADERATLRKHGIRVLAYPTPLREGLNEVRQRLKLRPDGTPGLVVARRCENTIREFNSYRYPERREDSESKDVPEKKNDHAMDALRYLCWGLKMLREGRRGGRVKVTVS